MKTLLKSHFFQISEIFFRFFRANLYPMTSVTLFNHLKTKSKAIENCMKFQKPVFTILMFSKIHKFFLPASAKESKHIWLFRKTRRIFCTSLLRWPWMALAVIAKKHEKSPSKSFYLKFQKIFFSNFLAKYVCYDLNYPIKPP